MKYELPMHPEEVTKRLFSVLPKRTKDILDQRFGLGKNSSRMTLEAIGQKYDITRERVRQIEADGFSRIKKSPMFQEMKGVFVALERYFEDHGKVLREEKVLKTLASHPKHENHVYFLLSLHDPFLRYHESEDMHDRWAYGEGAHDQAKQALDGAVSELKKIGKPVDGPKLFEILSSSAKNVLGGSNAVSPALLTNWLELSKIISKNYFDEWGLIDFPEIKPRGVRDLSHVVLLRHGSPLHFSQVAEQIGKLIGKKVHVQTVHNELIKDDRFVLVGRGLYGLCDWGYIPGVVKDVIIAVLKKDGPMSKEKIVDAVLKQRFVKPNTVVINLDNKKYFKKLPDGRYHTK